MPVLIFMLLFAFWASWLAPRKGKSAGSAFVLGLLFGIFEIFYLLCQQDADRRGQ